MAFAQIFICDKCGEVDGIYHEEIDCDRDKIYPMYLCSNCYREVKPKMIDGIQCMRELTDEEIFWDNCCDEDF